jgi:hypothetical protein
MVRRPGVWLVKTGAGCRGVLLRQPQNQGLDVSPGHRSAILPVMDRVAQGEGRRVGGPAADDADGSLELDPVGVDAASVAARQIRADRA